MRKGDKGKKVFGAIAILAIIVSVFGGIVSAANVSGGLKQSVDDAELFDKNKITDQQKQYEMLNLVNSHRGSLPAERVLAIIYQEGGEGAFHVDGWNYNPIFYRESDGAWAQPTNNDDGIMQVTAASGYHENSGPYTHDCTGYIYAINDGCNYLLELYSRYATQVQSTLHYNTGPKSLYIYLGMNQGDRDYLSKVAEHLSSFVPNTYGLSNQNLVNALNQGQNILDKYLYDMGIATGQSVGYYKPYQTQLDSELHNIEAPNQQPTAIIDSITTDPAEQRTDTISFTGHGADPDGTVEAYNWSSSIDGPLSISATFTKPASELSVGTHTIYFKVQDNDGAWSTEDTVDLTIYPGAELSYSPESHDFSDMCEGETDSTTFELWNSETGTLTYSLSETCDWLEVNPASGASTRAHNTITVDLDTTGLSEGTHTGDITINSNDGSGTFTVRANIVPSTGSISVSSSPSGAKIYLDNKYEGKTPHTITEVPPGHHTIELSLECFRDWSTNLQVTAGETAYVHAILTPLPICPDLVITGKWLCWPDNCTICYNVTNTGDGTAPACHKTTLYVDGVAVAHDHVPVDLAPGESYTGCFNGYEWEYTPPSDNITVCADNSETLFELDEDNNCLTNIWMCGDVNCDGKVTMSDVRKVFNRYLDPSYPLDLPWAADVNYDGRVTMSDVRKVFSRYLDPGYELECCCEDWLPCP